MPRQNEPETKIARAMQIHRDRLRLADALAATLEQHAAEQADALAALAIAMQRLTAIRIADSYAGWRAEQADDGTAADPPEPASPYAAAMAAELSE